MFNIPAPQILKGNGQDVIQYQYIFFVLVYKVSVQKKVLRLENVEKFAEKSQPEFLNFALFVAAPLPTFHKVFNGQIYSPKPKF